MSAKQFVVGRTLAAVLAMLLPAFAGAQAWLPDAHSLSYSLSYTNVYNKKHYLPDGNEIDVGHTRTNSIDFSVSYSPTDWMSMTVGLPFVQTQYNGNRPHPTEVDDGGTHSTWTDFHAAVQFQAIDDVVALAPYVAVIIPVTDYETMGHAAPGRGLNEYWAGFALGTSFDAWVPDTYAQVRYNYAFVEEVAGVSHDRSNIDLEIGYFLTPLVSARLLGQWQQTHGGIDVPIPPSNPLFPYHDQLAGDDHCNAGVGVSWSLTPRMGVELLYMSAISGRNGHKMDQGFFVSFSFGAGGGH